jgi:hypothetical protein
MFVATLSYLAICCLCFLALPYIWLLGSFVPLLIIAIDLKYDNKEPGFLAKLLFRLAILGTFPIIALIVNYLISGQILSKYYFTNAGTWVFGKWIASMAVSTVAVFIFLRSGSQLLNKAKSKLTRKTDLERNKKTDIRSIDEHVPDPIVFDPAKYVDLEKGCFLGLDENERPVYIPPPGTGKAGPHIQVVGTTGGGKGVSLGVMATQFLQRGEAVFFCDPKDDEWAPMVLFAAAKRLGVPYHFINLNAPNGPQFNIFEGATKEEVFELFIGGFSLTERGGGSDFYGIADRQAAMTTAALLAESGGTAAQVYEQVADSYTKDGVKFAGKLREMAVTPSVNATRGGVDFASIVAKGGIVYIVGSMRNDIVKTIQRMLLVRFIQLAERRDRVAGSLRPVCIVLDEVKYHISRPALEGLGAARDKGVHLVLAHQSLGDLRDCPKDIDPSAVVDAVVENCRIKIFYAVENPDTAEWLAKMTGKILADDEARQVKKNLAQAEIVEGGRTIRQADRYLMDENILMSLKPSTCVIRGIGRIAKFATIQPFKVPKTSDAITPVIVSGAAAATPAEALSLDDDDFPDPMAPPDYSEEPEPQELAMPDPALTPKPKRPSTATPSPAKNPLDLDDL